MAERNANLARRVRGVPESHDLTDRYFREVTDDLTGGAVDYWTPDAANVGAAGPTLKGLVRTLVQMTVGAGTPLPLLATVSLDTPPERQTQDAPRGAPAATG